MQAEQGLAAAALYVAEMRKEVNQRQAELWAAERERRVGAALAGQLPRLQRWQSMQVKSALMLTLQWTRKDNDRRGKNMRQNMRSVGTRKENRWGDRQQGILKEWAKSAWAAPLLQYHCVLRQLYTRTPPSLPLMLLMRVKCGSTESHPAHAQPWCTIFVSVSWLPAA